MSRSILVTGAEGQVGRELVTLGAEAGYRVTGVGRSGLDITDAVAVQAFLNASKPDIVINSAAYTAVDKAEQELEQALKVNRDGPANLAQGCRTLRIPLIHISTDYVFAGNSVEPYCENDPIAPLGAYGSSKAEGERAIQAAWGKHLIVRTSWVFGAHGNNFVKTMLRVGAERDHLRVVQDQFGCPTSAADIAKSLLAMAAEATKPGFDAWGIYHFSNSGITNWWGFAREIFHQAAIRAGRREPFVEPIATEDYPLPAKRPAYSVMNCKKVRDTFGIEIRPWPQALGEVLDKLLV